MLHSVYGHPHNQTNTPLPCRREGLQNLNHYIPSFEVDPNLKNRFVDEIAFIDTAVSSRKRSRTETPPSDEDAVSRGGEGDNKHVPMANVAKWARTRSGPFVLSTEVGCRCRHWLFPV